MLWGFVILFLSSWCSVGFPYLWRISLSLAWGFFFFYHIFEDFVSLTWKSSLLSIPRIQTFGISGGPTFPVFTFTVTFTFKFHTIGLLHLVILPCLWVLIFFYLICSTCKTIPWILLLNYYFTVHLYQNWSHLQYLYSFTEFYPKFHIELQSQDCFFPFPAALCLHFIGYHSSICSL